MANESIEKQRQLVFSQCRELMKSVNGVDCVPADLSCQCCDEPRPEEDITQIDSGQLLCPICMNSFKCY